MEKYLEKLLLQIRCKKARPYIAEEIRGHIESQIEDNIADGMSYEEAEKNAVADMGDPVTVGISLDKIHKPQIAWKLLVIVGILSLLGILLQQSIFYQSGYSNLEPFMQEMYQLETESFVYSVFIGFVLMCGIYFIDYTVIAKYSKIIGFVEIIYVFLTIFLYLLKCPQSLILSALRAFCFCGKPHISRSIFLYFRYQAWLKSW